MKCWFVIAFLLTALFAVGTESISAANDEQAVRALIDASRQYWNAHDMEGFASLFADDADFVNVRGMRWLGRSAIKEAHVQSHSHQFKNSRLTINETSVRFLKPDVAVSRSLWELVGYTTPTGEVGEPRKGIITNVVVKQNDKWQIVITQNTDIVPAP